MRRENLVREKLAGFADRALSGKTSRIVTPGMLPSAFKGLHKAAYKSLGHHLHVRAATVGGTMKPMTLSLVPWEA